MKGQNTFTTHHFDTALECSSRLYYNARSFPENQQSEPFIEHTAYNRRLITSLLRSAYPGGRFVTEASDGEAFRRTEALLRADEAVLFNAVFRWNGMVATLPVVEKSGDRWTIFHVRTRAFNPSKHRLSDADGTIFPKWHRYLIRFAYEIHLIRRNYPDSILTPVLVMPDKTGKSTTGNLHSRLFSNDKEARPAGDIPAAEQNLLVKLDITEEIDTVFNSRHFAEEHFGGTPFEEVLNTCRELYFNHRKAPPEIGAKCKQCEFRIEPERKLHGAESGFDICWRKHLPEAGESGTLPHVFDLIGPGTDAWIERGIYDQRWIPADEYTDPETIVEGNGRISEKMRQSLQIARAKGEAVPPEVIRPQLLNELDRWSFPLHFLDFEAGNYAIPVRKNRKPYHLVVFQFSCHTLFEDGRWSHHEWLDDMESGYPSYELVRQLRQVPFIEEGTLVQYSNFERNALKGIRNELSHEIEVVPDAEELAAWISGMVARNDSSSEHPPFIADLSRLVKHYYYNDRMENSLSIKDVLQSVLSFSSYLKQKYSEPYSGSNFDDIVWWQPDGNGQARNPYRILAGASALPVQRGTEAMIVYSRMISRDLDKKEEESCRNSLMKYCELDTLAMLMICEHWRNLSTDNL